MLRSFPPPHRATSQSLSQPGRGRPVRPQARPQVREAQHAVLIVVPSPARPHADAASGTSRALLRNAAAEPRCQVPRPDHQLLAWWAPLKSEIRSREGSSGAYPALSGWDDFAPDFEDPILTTCHKPPRPARVSDEIARQAEYLRDPYAKTCPNQQQNRHSRRQRTRPSRDLDRLQTRGASHGRQ